MPIRINLLAEAQATEELRRKDPVKRAFVAGILVVLVVLVWSSTVQVKIMASKSELANLQASWKSLEKTYAVAVENRRRSLEADEKLLALQRLTTNRFLWGTTFNALQQTLNGLDDVQVVRVKTEQSYTLSEEAKPRPGVIAKAATSTEKVLFTIEALDSSAQPGANINRFKSAIASEAFFQASLNKSNGVALLSFSPPQVDAGRNPYVKFSLQCLFPEKVR